MKKAMVFEVVLVHEYKVAESLSIVVHFHISDFMLKASVENF